MGLGRSPPSDEGIGDEFVRIHRIFDEACMILKFCGVKDRSIRLRRRFCHAQTAGGNEWRFGSRKKAVSNHLVAAADGAPLTKGLSSCCGSGQEKRACHESTRAGAAANRPPARSPQLAAMNSPLRVRSLAVADLAFADSVRALAGWNQTLDDWRRFLAADPEGCFLAEWNGAPAGTATTTFYAPELAWIGMVLVHPSYRRRGIARAFLGRAIEYPLRRRPRCLQLH